MGELLIMVALLLFGLAGLLAVPRPGLLYKILRASHPPIGERVDFINAYHPR